MTSTPFSTPQQIADIGHRIYDERYRASYEASFAGQYVVIDVNTEIAYTGVRPESALEAARAANPNGLFHLLKVGAQGAFRVSFTLHAPSDGPFCREYPAPKAQDIWA